MGRDAQGTASYVVCVKTNHGGRALANKVANRQDKKGKSELLGGVGARWGRTGLSFRGKKEKDLLKALRVGGKDK